MPSVILLSKQDRFSRAAQQTARKYFGLNVSIHDGQVGDPEPDALRTDGPDYLISFLSPWIVRQATLDRCRAAINFHPGSVEYPGTGCYNFALYDGTATYGAVCHHMLAKVDTGPIIAETRFGVLPKDTVETLKLRTMEAMSALFEDVMALIAQGQPLPFANTRWTRAPYTRRELEALKEICHRMDAQERERRMRATIYPGYPGPFLRRPNGSIFLFPVPDRPALA